MAKKTREEALRTRETIIDAAVRVFSVQGVAQTTLKDIAEEAGVTRGAIYWHFKNKADLFSVLWDDLFSPFDVVRDVADKPGEQDPLGVLHKACLDLFVGLQRYPRRRQMFNLLLLSETAEDPSYQLHSCQFQEGLEVVGRMLASAVQRGQLPKSFDVRLGALAIISFISGLVRKWLMYPDQLRLTREIPALLEGMIQMLHCAFSESPTRMAGPGRRTFCKTPENLDHSDQ
ncbi:MAG: TetR family transcriptional regulator [Desulfopila sp.]